MIPFFNFKSITPMAPKYMTTILDWFFKNTIEDYEWFNPHDDMRIHKSNINLYIEMKNIWVKEIIALQYFDNIEDDIKKLCKTVFRRKYICCYFQTSFFFSLTFQITLQSIIVFFRHDNRYWNGRKTSNIPYILEYKPRFFGQFFN